MAGKKGAKGKNGATGGKGDGEAAVKKTRKPSTVMWRVSDELAAVVGSNEATVDTIRTGVYGYIKEHDLQVRHGVARVVLDVLERFAQVFSRRWHACLLSLFSLVFATTQVTPELL